MSFFVTPTNVHTHRNCDGLLANLGLSFKLEYVQVCRSLVVELAEIVMEGDFGRKDGAADIKVQVTAKPSNRQRRMSWHVVGDNQWDMDRSNQTIGLSFACFHSSQHWSVLMIFFTKLGPQRSSSLPLKNITVHNIPCLQSQGPCRGWSYVSFTNLWFPQEWVDVNSFAWILYRCIAILYIFPLFFIISLSFIHLRSLPQPNMCELPHCLTPTLPMPGKHSPLLDPLHTNGVWLATLWQITPPLRWAATKWQYRQCHPAAGWYLQKSMEWEGCWWGSITHHHSLCSFPFS